MLATQTSPLVPPPNKPAALPPRMVDTLVIHCSATPSGQGLGIKGVQNAAQVIDGWHRARGFARAPAAAKAFNASLPHIGYHYVVDLNGNALNGRSLGEVGAHVAGHNARSIGVCLVGGAERHAAYTRAQWLMLGTLVREMRRQYGAGLRIVGHRDLSPDLNGDQKIKPNEWLKTCPGFEVADWLAQDPLGLSALPGHVYGESA